MKIISIMIFLIWCILLYQTHKKLKKEKERKILKCIAIREESLQGFNH